MTKNHDDLTKGVPYSEIMHFVAEASPALIEALEKASQEYHRHEESWQEEVARHQHNVGMPRRSLESPYGKALNEASTAVLAAFEEMLPSGQLVYGGFPAGQLDGRRPRGLKISIRGITGADREGGVSSL